MQAGGDESASKERHMVCLIFQGFGCRQEGIGSASREGGSTGGETHLIFQGFGSASGRQSGVQTRGWECRRRVESASGWGPETVGKRGVGS